MLETALTKSGSVSLYHFNIWCMHNVLWAKNLKNPSAFLQDETELNPSNIVQTTQKTLSGKRTMPKSGIEPKQDREASKRDNFIILWIPYKNSPKNKTVGRIKTDEQIASHPSPFVFFLSNKNYMSSSQQKSKVEINTDATIAGQQTNKHSSDLKKARTDESEKPSYPTVVNQNNNDNCNNSNNVEIENAIERVQTSKYLVFYLFQVFFRLIVHLVKFIAVRV